MNSFTFDDAFGHQHVTHVTNRYLDDEFANISKKNMIFENVFDFNPEELIKDLKVKCRWKRKQMDCNKTL